MFVTTNGQSHHVLLAGDPRKPPIVLLHSLGTSALVWGPQIADLSADHFVICPDFRGHGLTAPSVTAVSVGLLARDVMGILDALSVDHFHLAGLSIGGMVAQEVAAIGAGRVRALAIFDSSIVSLNPKMWRERADKIRQDGLASLAPGILSRWVTPETSAGPETAGLSLMLAQASGEGYAAGCDALAIADCRAGTAALAIPVLVAVGSADQATPRDASEALVAAIPNAQLRVIDGAAHIPTLHQPAAVTGILRDLLAL